LDLDGEDEYTLSNDKVFSIFENDGGRVEYAFAYDTKTGPIQLIAPINQYVVLGEGGGWTHADGELAVAPTWNRGPDSAFIDDLDYNYSLDYDPFTVTVTTNTILFTSPDNKVTKTFTLNEDTIFAHYELNGSDILEPSFGLAVNMMNMFEPDWDENIEPYNPYSYVGWQTTQGGLVLVSDLATISNISFTDSPAKDEMKERDNPETYPLGHWLFYPYHTINIYGGDVSFDISLTLSANYMRRVYLPLVSDH
jgi:hypothetical protein